MTKYEMNITSEVDELITRAEAIATALVERQAETEARGYYAEDTHEEFKAAGFYRILVPAELGGLGADIETYGRVVKALARGCPGTAWQFSLGSSHATNICMLYDPSLWSEIFTDGESICPLPARPQGEIRQLENGDWSLSGTYNYCSGVPYATHLLGNAFPIYRDGSRGSPVGFLAQRSDWVRLDDWNDAFGMKGSGSFSVRFDEARIPDRYVLHVDMFDFQPTPLDLKKPSLRTNPAYYAPFEAFAVFELAAVGVGAVQGALDEYAKLMKTKTSLNPPFGLRIEDPDYRSWYGRAIGRLAMADAALFGMASQWTEIGRRHMLGGPPCTVEESIRLTLLCGEIIDVVWGIMQTLWMTMGTSPAQNGQRMQRVFRDVAMLRNHGVATTFDARARKLADHELSKRAIASVG